MRYKIGTILETWYKLRETTLEGVSKQLKIH